MIPSYYGYAMRTGATSRDWRYNATRAGRMALNLINSWALPDAPIGLRSIVDNGVIGEYARIAAHFAAFVLDGQES